MKVLLIDNYDSFVHNVKQQLWGLGAEVTVVRNDGIDLDGVRALDPSHIVLSPGPGRPENPRDFGVCRDVLDGLPEVPTLGICLGHQGLGWRLGAEVVRAPSIVHGKVDTVLHDGVGLFAGLPSPLEVMRYHSLVLAPNSLPQGLRVTARTTDGIVMAVAEEGRPRFGLQFHPESIGTPRGAQVMQNFLEVR